MLIQVYKSNIGTANYHNRGYKNPKKIIDKSNNIIGRKNFCNWVEVSTEKLRFDWFERNISDDILRR